MDAEPASLADKIIAKREKSQESPGDIATLRKKKPALYYAVELIKRYQFYTRRDDKDLPATMRKLYVGHKVFPLNSSSISAMLGRHLNSDICYQIYAALVQGAPTLSDEALWVGKEILYKKGTGSFTPIITPHP